MGCDIHAYIEYRRKGDKEQRQWSGFAHPHLCRAYSIFEAMAGVRGESSLAVAAPRGQPKDISWWTQDDAYLYVYEDDNAQRDGCCSLSNAKRWIESGISKPVYYPNEPEKLWRVTHPNWHTHSWLSADEFERAINNAYLRHCFWLREEAKDMKKSPLFKSMTPEAQKRLYEAPDKKNWAPEYQATLATLRAFEAAGMEARLVFWFDN